MLAAVFVAGDVRHSVVAQTPTTIDYDVDDDGLIEVKTKAQLQAIHYDLNGDGTAENRGGWPSAPTAYAMAYLTPMTAMGLPPPRPRQRSGYRRCGIVHRLRAGQRHQRGEEVGSRSGRRTLPRRDQTSLANWSATDTGCPTPIGEQPALGLAFSRRLEAQARWKVWAW